MIKNRNTIWNKDSCEEGFQLPVFATADLPTAKAGLTVYNSTTSTIYFSTASTWAAIDTSSSASSLDGAYNAGNTIDIDAAGGELAIDFNATGSVITLDADTNSVTVTDGIKFATTGTSSAFTDAIDVSDSGITNAINIGENAIAGTNFSVTGAGAVTAVGVNAGSGAIATTGNLTVGSSKFSVTGSSGAVVAGNITGIASQTLAIASGATAQALTLNANGAGTVGLGNTSTGDITIGNGSVTDLGLTATTTTITGDLTLTGTATIGSFNLSAVQPASGNLTLNGATGATTVTIGNLSTGGIVISDNMSVGAPIVMNSTNDISFNAATEKIWSSTASQLDLAATTEIQLATATVDINAATAFLVDGANFSLDATGASNVTVTGANLTLGTTTTGNLDVNVAQVFTLDCVGNSDITVDSGNFEINCTTSGIVTLDGFTEIDFEIANTDEMKYTTGSMEFQQTTSISTTAGALTLAPTTDVLISNGLGLVVGHTAQISTGGSATPLTTETFIGGTAVADGSATLYTASATAANASKLVFGRSKAASLGTYTIVADNDALGSIDFCGTDGTDTNTVSARISAEVDDGSPTTSDIGGALVFLTHVGGSTDNISEKARISAAGDLLVANGGGLVVGHTGQIAAGATSEFQVLGTALADGSAIIGVAAASALAPDLQFVKSRSADTFTTPAVVVDNDEIGRLVFLPDDGTDYATEAAVFQAEVDDATPATGDIGMAFVWESMAGGGAAIAERMRLSAAGDLSIANGGGVIIGSAAQITAGAASEFQVLGTGLADSSCVFGAFSADAVGPDIQFVKSRHATLGSNTIVVDDDVVGRIVWLPADGSDFATEAATFHAEVDDASPAAGDVGMAFVWKNMPGGAGAIAENMRLSAVGTLSVTTSVITPIVVGGVASGGDLCLQSTTHGTEGTIYAPDGTAGLHLGAVAGGWAADNYLYLEDATVAPAGASGASGAGIYSAGGELFTIDKDGNATQQTPHDKDGNWFTNSYRAKEDITRTINIEKFMRKVMTKFPGEFDDCIQDVKGNKLSSHK